MSDLPAGWEWSTVASVAESLVDGPFGSNLKTEHYQPSGVRVVRLQNIADGRFDDADKAYISEEHAKILSRHEVRPRDLLIAAMGDVLPRVCLAPPNIERAIVKADCFRLRPREDVLPEFLAHMLSAPQTRRLAATQIAGVGRPRLNLKKVSALTIPHPPRAEQERIVSAIEEQFSRIDAGISVLERAQQNLSRMRTAVLQAAVTGRLLPQDKAEGSGADLLATITLAGRRADRRQDKLTTNLPPLPQNWSAAPWSSIGYSQNGRAFPSADYTTAGVRLLRPGNFYSSGQVGWTVDNTRHLPPRYATEFPSYLVRDNEIIMNLTAQSLKDDFLGRVCMTGQAEQPVLLNQRLARLTPVSMNTRFVFYVLKSPLFRRFVDQLNTGSLIQHMFTSQLDQFMFPIPPRNEQNRIVEALEGILTLFESLDKAILEVDRQAIALRSSILEAAFSGKLT